MEKFSKGLLSALGPDAAAAAEAGDAKSMDDYLHKIALDTYKRTGSWLKAYQAVFAVYAPISQSDLSRHYAAAELNEIAEVYAYHFNEDLPKPQGAALARLNKLAAKHQLKHSDSFDDIGYTVSRTVNEAVKEYQRSRNIRSSSSGPSGSSSTKPGRRFSPSTMRKALRRNIHSAMSRSACCRSLHRCLRRPLPMICKAGFQKSRCRTCRKMARTYLMMPFTA